MEARSGGDGCDVIELLLIAVLSNFWLHKTGLTAAWRQKGAQ
jgi:hypothetical protein